KLSYNFSNPVLHLANTPLDLAHLAFKPQDNTTQLDLLIGTIEDKTILSAFRQAITAHTQSTNINLDSSLTKQYITDYFPNLKELNFTINLSFIKEHCTNQCFFFEDVINQPLTCHEIKQLASSTGLTRSGSTIPPLTENVSQVIVMDNENKTLKDEFELLKR